MQALNATRDMSAVLEGINVEKAAICIPMLLGLLNPHNAQVAMVKDLWLITGKRRFSLTGVIQTLEPIRKRTPFWTMKVGPNVVTGSVDSEPR